MAPDPCRLNVGHPAIDNQTPFAVLLVADYPQVPSVARENEPIAWGADSFEDIRTVGQRRARRVTAVVERRWRAASLSGHPKWTEDHGVRSMTGLLATVGSSSASIPDGRRSHPWSADTRGREAQDDPQMRSPPLRLGALCLLAACCPPLQPYLGPTDKPGDGPEDVVPDLIVLRRRKGLSARIVPVAARGSRAVRIRDRELIRAWAGGSLVRAVMPARWERRAPSPVSSNAERYHFRR